MAKRGRQPGIKLPETHRDKIRNSNVLLRLISHAEGTVDMKATEVQAALGLLKKSLPDLQSVDLKADVKVDALGELLKHVKSNGKRL
jgi:hypothetical protein